MLLNVYSNHKKSERRDHSNTSVVHMPDQRFFKTYPNGNLPSPGKTPPKREFRANMPPNLPLNKPFWRTCLVEFEKMTPKRPLIEFKGTLFLKNRHILTPNHDSRESRLASKKATLFFAFLWSCMCTTLLFECPPPLQVKKYT